VVYLLLNVDLWVVIRGMDGGGGGGVKSVDVKIGFGFLFHRK